jgi:hypothetical protein
MNEYLKENLTKTSHDLEFARGNLQAALHYSNAVESIIILDLIGSVTNLLVNTSNLLNALTLDGKEGTK